MSDILIDLRSPSIPGGPSVGLWVHCIPQDWPCDGKPWVCHQTILTHHALVNRRVAFGATPGEALMRGEQIAAKYGPDETIPRHEEEGIAIECLAIHHLEPGPSAAAKAMEGPRAVRFHFGRGTITGLCTAVGDDLIRIDSVDSEDRPVIFSASSKGWDAEVLSNLEYAVAQRDARERWQAAQLRKRLREVPRIRVLVAHHIDSRDNVISVRVPELGEDASRTCALDHHTDDVPPWRAPGAGWRWEAYCTIDYCPHPVVVVHGWVGESIAPAPGEVATPTSEAVEPTSDPDSAAQDDEGIPY